MKVENIEPKLLWENFVALNAVPRASKKEERVIAFIKAFGNNLNLPTLEDQIGNVIIKKPATKGMENCTTVVLQSHLDMVHQKNAETDFDFDSQGIEMFVDGDWVKANGTTLGADNGIGVASIMTLLQSTDIAHPPLEALFTIDEETGMTGALGLKGGLLDAKIMLNLDTEDDNELTIGCAGGVDVTATGTYVSENIPTGMLAYTLRIKGLTGGHSGMDIHKGRCNANKLMNRLLIGAEKFGLRIASLDGGGLRNAIPRESAAELLVAENFKSAFEAYIVDQTSIYKSEYKSTDPNLEIIYSPSTASLTCIPAKLQYQFLRILYNLHNGIYRMSPDIPGLVQTSNNVARVLLKDGKYTIQCLTRSSVNSEKDDLANALTAGCELLGASVTQTGAYPGWTPNPNAKIVKLMEALYENRFSAKPLVNACHAGLECGILGQNYPEMEMISFGPNIRGAHSPDEMVQISSVQKFWGFLLETLQKIK